MATVITDDWSEEKCIQLIREFRARPVLWDQKDPFFFKKTMKPGAWIEIGNILNISPDKCKHKMIILMSSFRREKAKIMHSLKDPSQVYKSTWFAFKDLAFLMDKENERKRQLTGAEDDDDEDSIPNMLRNHVGTPLPMKKVRRTPSVKKELTTMVTQSIRDDVLNDVTSLTQPAPGPSQTAAERDDEIKSFTSFIGNKMKKYSDTTKNAVQQAICDVIFKADQNYYEPNCFDKFTIIDDETDPLNKAIYNIDSRIGTIIKVQNDSDDSD